MDERLPQVWIVTQPEHPEGPVTPLRRALVECPPGAVGVQLRAKDVGDRQLVEWARELRAMTRDFGAVLTINRRPDVAAIVEADGVHLPERGLPVERVRQEWPGLSLVGVSRHDRSGLRRADEDGASYAFLSPVFEVPGKNPPLGAEGFLAAIAGVGIPTYALGGVEPEHVSSLRAAGAAGVAVRRAIYDSPKPQAVLERLLCELDKNASNGE